MRILVVGSGGREHALSWKIAQSPLVSEVLCAPGNAGIASVARCVASPSPGAAGIVELARREEVGLVVIGPEAELADGAVDRLAEAGIPAFGPSAAAAQLEASKSFAKEIMAEAGVPTAAYSKHTDFEGALEAAGQRDGRCVIKADGLAAGKGVIVCQGMEEAEAALRTTLVDRAFGEAGASAIVEDLLVGEELSVLALCDGTSLVTMIAAQDHKAALDGDQGPNTGGMGAYAPAPLGDAKLLDEVRLRVLEPTVATMARRGTPLKGVLYAGLMVQEGVPYVLEFNVRFGDPETQPLMAMLAGDLVPLLSACAAGDLGDRELTWHKGAAVCVVMASGGYPGSYAKGLPIEGLGDVEPWVDVEVFHAGTKLDDGRVVTSGGRVLGVTARGADVAAAQRRAYEAVEAISFEGEHHRSDIAYRAIGR